MSVAAIFKPKFDSGDRSRGESYFRGDLVEIVDVDDRYVLADVEGSDTIYDVTIALDQPIDSAATCNCPRFADGFHCKHIWATLRKIDEVALLGADDQVAFSPKSVRRGVKKPAPAWQQMFSRAEQQSNHRRPVGLHHEADANVSPIDLWFVIDITSNFATRALRVSLFMREQNSKRQWGRVSQFHADAQRLAKITDPELRRAIKTLRDSNVDNYRYYHGSQDGWTVDEHIADNLLTQAAKTGRLAWCLDQKLLREELAKFQDADCTPAPDEMLDVHCVSWDSAIEGEIAAELIEQTDGNTQLKLNVLANGQAFPQEEIVLVTADGFLLLKDRLLRVKNPEASVWLEAASAAGGISIPPNDRAEFLKKMTASRSFPSIEIPPSWDYQESSTGCRGKVLVKQQQQGHATKGNRKHDLDFYFVYGDEGSDKVASEATDTTVEFHIDSPTRTAIAPQRSLIVRRDIPSERELLEQLIDLPIQREQDYLGVTSRYSLGRHIESVVSTLANRGWQVFMEGQQLRSAGGFSMSVESSGQDWFDLSAEVKFEGQSIELPELLSAIRAEQNYVQLSDGSRGSIPSELLQQLARLSEMGTDTEDSLRFRPSQAMLLDAMLAAQDSVSFDRKFRNLRKKLHSFDGIKPKQPTRGFCGELRDYQTDGLSWLHFLREFRFGGCLADDMGLGKTVQVLALLESRRTRRVEKGAVRQPTIVVVPKSLIFNWISEAEKFAPKLRVFNYTGTDRKTRFAEVGDGEFDVLLTTYATMRNDIFELKEIPFDYAILDESQAIKNANSQAAKASRLLQADHRLAMTGTPIENHAGELWSLFEFLNPGMLGSNNSFKTKRKDEDTAAFHESLSRGLRPFFLRRTKSQVLKDLPEKTEQTIICDMTPAQKKQYNEVREYYRVKLSKKIKTSGLKNSKIHVLEALLRLRQVACDPRLLDAKKKPGIKTDVLMQHIEEVLSEGHKALIFSQFTSLLSLLKKQLDKKSIAYEYLDGKTARREEKVKNFQETDDIGLFLISLKAGGSGLNLTAADYVFILDPWWNPAVEAQAIDRAHRIGQQRSVNAYRLICRDTVEEKIVKLQESKRELADSIISADGSLIQSLTSDDLQLLLS